MFRNKYLNIVLHVLIWSIYLALPAFILPRPSAFFQENEFQLLVYFVIGFCTIGFHYYNYHFTVPRYFFNRQYFKFGISIVVFVLFAILITKLCVQLSGIPVVFTHEERRLLFSLYWSRFLVIFVVSLGLRFNQRLKQIESDKVKSELMSLKTKLNPHFLFNVLNDIYGQAITNSDDTANSIAKLSSMMRHVLTEVQDQKVSLEKEISYLKNYIALQRIRLTDKTKVVFEIEGAEGGKEIPPLIFISFIENAFKYGVSNEVESTIMIRIEIKTESIALHVKNSNFKRNVDQSKSNSIGIENTKRRLELIFGNAYKLDIQDLEDSFEVNLELHSLKKG